MFMMFSMGMLGLFWHIYLLTPIIIPLWSLSPSSPYPPHTLYAPGTSGGGGDGSEGQDGVSKMGLMWQQAMSRTESFANATVIGATSGAVDAYRTIDAVTAIRTPTNTPPTLSSAAIDPLLEVTEGTLGEKWVSNGLLNGLFGSSVSFLY